MSKTNNKLIFISGVFSFILGLLLSASPVYARGGVVESGLTFTPYNYPIQYLSNPVPNQTSIPGCEGRNTGFSTINGQSCVGNNINNTNNADQNTNTTSSNITNTTTKNSNTTTENNNTVSKITDTNNTIATLDSNSSNKDTYGSLTANALIGSNSFMPTGLLQWIICIILILAIIFLWRYVHNSKDKYMSSPMKHA